MSKNDALRFDDDKLRLDLIPPEVMLHLGRVMTHGARKYSARNWEKGMDWSRCLSALKRHLLRWELGQMYDSESGEPHLSHVLWNAMALLVYEQRDIGNNDLPTQDMDWGIIDELFTVQSKSPREGTAPSLGYMAADPVEEVPPPRPVLELEGALAARALALQPEPASLESRTSTCPCRACNPSYSRNK